MQALTRPASISASDDVAVAIGIEPETGLECRDLGLVDDDVEVDRVRFDPDPRVVVDREVAERMGGHEGRGEEQERDGPEDRDEGPARTARTGGHGGASYPSMS